MIDAFLPSTWPKAVREATSAYEQGDLVERPPFFYWADPAHPVWQVTAAHAESEDPYPLVELDESDCPEYGIVTTQSCDLDEIEPKKPWLQVAPVYDEAWFDRESLPLIHAQKHRHLFSLPPIPNRSRRYIADLRIEFPLEKGWLVGKLPVRCLLDLPSKREFARKLSSLRGRPALDGPAEDIVRHLRKRLGRLSKEKRDALMSEIPHDGLRAKLIGSSSVTGLQLYVVSEGDELSAATRKWFDSWTDRLDKDSVVPGDFDFLGVIFTTLHALGASTYRDLVELDLL